MPNWTEEQQKVIDGRDCNMIVSAAAGSGKTAVLVERILQKITNPIHPVDIDQIVVVTFTKAAAAEMRERILSGILKLLDERPEDTHLIRQATLVHGAFITTIDSFCSYLVRNYFYEIDLDPAFRVGDNAEIELLEEKVLEDLMEEEHALASADGKPYDTAFYRLLRAYAGGTSDAKVGDMIRQLYQKSQSFPWPEEFLDGLVAPYQIHTVEELKESAWFFALIAYLREEVSETLLSTKHAREICESEGGPRYYLANIDADCAMYEEMLRIEDDATFYDALFRLGSKADLEFSYSRLKPKPRGKALEEAGLDEEKCERVKGMMQSTRKHLTDTVCANYCADSLETILDTQVSLLPYVEELIRLTKRYSVCFSERKRDKNLVDFSDLEHFALQILVDPVTKQPRPVADALSEQFDEIMIDEYQDSNYIQEEILSVVSGERRGVHNRFMVGDVKQSIYSFRQAQPDIFVETYQRFLEEEQSTVIDLQHNFRSRTEVLDATNAVFDQLMHKDLGDVEYDDKARLSYGAKEFYGEADAAYQMKIVCANLEKDGGSTYGSIENEEGGEVAEDPIEYENKIEVEFSVIAEEIRQLMRSSQVMDKETKTKRAVRYSDIVILMRSPNSVAGQIISLLEEKGIPTLAESRQGYFDATEVQTMLNLLRILDNPYQDIPFAAVLRSPIFHFSDDDLAEIHTPKASIYQSLCEMAENGDKRAADVLAFIDLWRSQIKDLPIHRLIEELLEATGYLRYVSALPRGEIRKANLQKLVDEAIAYETSSYKGLFHFVRYMEHCKKNNIDHGEATANHGEDAVTLMSIHQSKGLEFPIVILAGTAKGFNDQDAHASLALHAKYGIGLDYVDVERNIKYKSLYKRFISLSIKQQTRGEEMRILYVAMTRAKEKLIVTGVLSKDEDEFLAKISEWGDSKEPLTYAKRFQASCYLEWILRATNEKRDCYPVTMVDLSGLTDQGVVDSFVRLDLKKQLESRVKGVSSEEIKKLKQQFSYVYPYAKSEYYKTKYSVSEIKHHSMEQVFLEKDYATPDFISEEFEPCVPPFISKKETTYHPGALRGTAMHRFLECFDFLSGEDETQQKERMISDGYLNEEQAELLQMKKLETFLASDVAERMKRADARGDLYREKPFVMQAIPADLFVGATSQEPVLVQGIIDAFFIEEGQIVLLDYKTDHVKEADELVDRYQMQLSLYADALQRARAMEVKDILIYSFSLNETIHLKK